MVHLSCTSFARGGAFLVSTTSVSSERCRCEAQLFDRLRTRTEQSALV